MMDIINLLTEILEDQIIINLKRQTNINNNSEMEYYLKQAIKNDKVKKALISNITFALECGIMIVRKEKNTTGYMLIF